MVHMHDTCTSPGRAWGWAGRTGALEADADFSKPQHVTS